MSRPPAHTPLVRDVEPDDFTAIAELTNHYIAHTHIHFGLAAVTAEELRSSWEKSRGRFPFMIAEADGFFAGFAKASTWRDRAAYEQTAEAGIYISPEMHRRGLGRTLYERLIAACRERGFHTLMGGIALPNEASVRLHGALGFTLVGTFRECGRKRDQWWDVAFYQLLL